MFQSARSGRFSPPPPTNVLRRVKFSSCVAAALAHCDIGRVFTCVEASGGGSSSSDAAPTCCYFYVFAAAACAYGRWCGNSRPAHIQPGRYLRFSELWLVSVELWLFLTLSGGGVGVKHQGVWGVRLVSCECKPGISPGWLNTSSPHTGPELTPCVCVSSN